MTSATSPTHDGLLALRSSAGVVLVASTVFASTVGFLNASVVNVAVPAIGHDLHAGVGSLQWVLTSYLLTVAALLLPGGALVDRFGQRRVLAVGLNVMLVASVVCAVAPSIGVLVAARVLQGAGAALVVPSSLALLNSTLRVADRARAIGVWAGLATLGATVAPFAGGWLVDHASWRTVFLLNVPLIVAGLLTLRGVPEIGLGRSDLSPDAIGALLAAVGLAGVTYALTSAPASGWLNARVLVAGVVGVGSLAALVPFERRLPAPTLRLSLFESRPFAAINATTVLFYGALSAAGYLLVLQCELRLGYSAAEAGAALFPESAVFLAVAPVSGALVSRIGTRWLMVAGIAAVAAAFVWLSRAQPGDGYTAAVLPGTLMWGIGDALAATPLTAAVLAAVDDRDLGEASAINSAAAWLGGLVAIATVPALIGAGGKHDLAHALDHGYQPGMIAMAGFAVTAALVTGVFVPDDRVADSRLGPDPRTLGCPLPISRSEAS